MFVGVVYMKKINDYVPGIFKNPIASDAQAFSQIMMFVPRRRLLDYLKKVDGDRYRVLIERLGLRK